MKKLLFLSLGLIVLCCASSYLKTKKVSGSKSKTNGSPDNLSALDAETKDPPDNVLSPKSETNRSPKKSLSQRAVTEDYSNNDSGCKYECSFMEMLEKEFGYV